MFHFRFKFSKVNLIIEIYFLSTAKYAKLLTFPAAVLNNNLIIIGNAVNASWKLAFFSLLYFQHLTDLVFALKSLEWTFVLRHIVISRTPSNV